MYAYKCVSVFEREKPRAREGFGANNKATKTKSTRVSSIAAPTSD